jgi:hypothetical protein
MAISDLPVFFDMRYTEESGKMTSDAFLYNDNLWQSLNNAVFLLNSIIVSSVALDADPEPTGAIINDGLVFPSKTTTEITAYGADNSIPNGAAWFNTTSSKLNVKTAAGVIEAITSVVVP